MLGKYWRFSRFFLYQLPDGGRISAIGLLKFYDQQAQLAYDNFFNLPVPPKGPEVSVVELNKKIVLDWGENQERVRAEQIESQNMRSGVGAEQIKIEFAPHPSCDVTFPYCWTKKQIIVLIV